MQRLLAHHTSTLSLILHTPLRTLPACKLPTEEFLRLVRQHVRHDPRAIGRQPAYAAREDLRRADGDLGPLVRLQRRDAGRKDVFPEAAVQDC